MHILIKDTPFIWF